ncbi:MAG: bifunctional metallophosphatase/5'-nucleotidase [Saprospiraceae bacterium]|nr:metallophosphatase [Bacteroidia bacterium]NNF23049.1 bifunctional metallophosphatase/5'-nucleotidase [Saprospiraceae bacterium]
MIQRRTFLQKSLTGSILLMSSQFPLSAFSSDPDFIKLNILHTNDVHSRIDPFPDDGGRNAGLGGAARRAEMIQSIRNKEKNVLLLDAGDIFQGTPYFNFFGGELEIKLMSKMGYDASTMGNHDFDAGIDGFDKQLVHADFPFIVSNYDFKNTVLNNKISPYKIFNVEDLKIGVIGTGIELKGLVPSTMYKETQYLDPISSAQKYANILKKDKACDYVICLSHLGYRYSSERISDVILAQNTTDIDLIIGGHTHTFMRKADTRRNLKGEQVIVTQAGWAGILLGHIEVYFERSKKKKCTSCKNKLVG